jgi:hypothetical protein
VLFHGMGRVFRVRIYPAPQVASIVRSEVVELVLRLAMLFSRDFQEEVFL